MKHIIILLLLIPLIILSSCKKEEEPDKGMPGIVLTPKQQAVVQASNEFGFHLLKKIDAGNSTENYFISPLSVSVALGMTYNGADGTTKSEMQQVLGFTGLTDLEINESYRDMIKYLLASDPDVVLKIANSIWCSLGFFVEPVFIQLNQQYFNAQVNTLDFSDPAAPGIINQWVTANTASKILKIVEQIDPSTVMILLNATYFKANWSSPFDKKLTAPATFYLDGGGTREVSTMQKKAEFYYMQNDLFEAVRLPYGDGRYSMVILLPLPSKSVSDIVAQMDVAQWQQWMASLQNKAQMYVYLPKFKFEFEKKLNDDLKIMGMPEAFEPGLANFSRINPNVGLFISTVKHKTYVDVNEEGTEAAAVTSVVIDYTSMPPVFNANRPFLFFITEKYTDFVVFAGKVAEPKYN